MNERYNFANKNFVIVGASSGIGRKVAMDLSDLNANIEKILSFQNFNSTT